MIPEFFYVLSPYVFFVFLNNLVCAGIENWGFLLLTRLRIVLSANSSAMFWVFKILCLFSSLSLVCDVYRLRESYLLLLHLLCVQNLVEEGIEVMFPYHLWKQSSWLCGGWSKFLRFDVVWISYQWCRLLLLGYSLSRGDFIGDIGGCCSDVREGSL